MKRIVRLIAGLSVALAALVVPQQARAEDPATSATSRFAACLSSAKQGDLVLLVDESASLRANDKGNGRVTASQVLMKGLATLESQAGVKLEVRVDRFSTSYADGQAGPRSTRARWVA